MTDTKHNGWTNYATWRVNLEMFDGLDATYYEWRDIHEAAAMLQQIAEEQIIDTSDEGLARNYALAFLSDVNWHEIAEHLMED